jgi:signal transduction histidine kinase/CheY-like chemotaxis protein
VIGAGTRRIRSVTSRASSEGKSRLTAGSSKKSSSFGFTTGSGSSSHIVTNEIRRTVRKYAIREIVGTVIPLCMTLVTLGVVLAVSFLLVTNAENAAFSDASAEALHSLGQFYSDKVNMYDVIRGDVLTESLPLSFANVPPHEVGDIVVDHEPVLAYLELMYPVFRMSPWMLGVEMVLPDGEFVQLTAESDPDVHNLLITHVRRINNTVEGSATVLFERRILLQDYEDPLPTLQVVTDWQPDAAVSLSLDIQHPWYKFSNGTRASTDLGWKWEPAATTSDAVSHIVDDDDAVVAHVEQDRFAWFGPDHVDVHTIRGEETAYAMDLVFRVDDPNIDDHYANFRVIIDLHSVEELLALARDSYEEHVDLAVIEATSGRVIHHTEPDYRLTVDGHDELKKLWELEGDIAQVTTEIINKEATGEIDAAGVHGERHDTDDLEVAIFHLPEVPTFELVIIARKNSLVDPESLLWLNVIIGLMIALTTVVVIRGIVSVFLVRSDFRATVKFAEERTKSKTRERIAQLKAMEEGKRSQAKTRFVSIMSHEIRNPLSGVILNADFLMATPLSEQQRGYCEGIGRSSKMLLTIVNDVLDMTKIESGKLALERIPFDLAAEVEFVVQTAAATAYERGIDLAVFVPPDLRRCFIGDPNRLRQILHNLVSNAIKFTARGHVSVVVKKLPVEERPIRTPPAAGRNSRRSGAAGSVRSGRSGRSGRSAAQSTVDPSTAGTGMVSMKSSSTAGRDDDDDHYVEYNDPVYVQFEVEDSGKGIPKDAQAKLFREFTQVDESTTRQFGGTGLGLYISKKLCNLMDGEIGVRSEAGHGSTFHFTVTLDQVDESAQAGRHRNTDRGSYSDSDSEGGLGLNVAKPTVVQPVQCAGIEFTIMIVAEDDAVRECTRKYMAHALSHAKRLIVNEYPSPFQALKPLRSKFTGPPERTHVRLVVYDHRILMDDVKSIVKKARGTHFVMLTQDMTAQAMEDLSQGGWEGFVQKPVMFARLSKVLESVVSSHRSWGPKGRPAHKRASVAPHTMQPTVVPTQPTLLMATDGAHGAPGQESMTSVMSGGITEETVPSVSEEDDVNGWGAEEMATVEEDAATADAPTVLLVDDFQMMRELVSSVLVSMGMNCVMAQNGREAVELFETRTFDMIFMDCEMPVMDGYSAVRAIRDTERTRGDGMHTPVIAMTANAMRQDRQKCFDAGMDDFLAKPLHRETIAKAVRKYTKRSRKARAEAKEAAAAAAASGEVREERKSVRRTSGGSSGGGSLRSRSREGVRTKSKDGQPLRSRSREGQPLRSRSREGQPLKTTSREGKSPSRRKAKAAKKAV